MTTSSPAGSPADRPASAFSAELRRMFSKDNPQLYPALTIAGLCLALLYCYGNSLDLTMTAWNDPKYSHGWMVPFLAAGLLWMRRKPIGRVSMKDRWWGVSLVAGALLVRVAAAMFRINTIDMYTLVPAVAGVFLLVGGRETLRWAAAPIGLLIFMFPLDMRLETRLLSRMQIWATTAATYALQTLGVEAFQEGNNIQIPQLHTPLGVVDQCAGLRMLTIFIGLSIAMCMVISATWWEKAVIVVSSVPIAVLVNLIRITVTGLLYLAATDSTWITDEFAQFVFHDAAGWLMMPMALGLMYLEMVVLNHLFVERKEVRAPMNLRTPRMAPAVAKSRPVGETVSDAR